MIARNNSFRPHTRSLLRTPRNSRRNRRNHRSFQRNQPHTAHNLRTPIRRLPRTWATKSRGNTPGTRNTRIPRRRTRGNQVQVWVRTPTQTRKYRLGRRSHLGSSPGSPRTSRRIRRNHTPFRRSRACNRSPESKPVRRHTLHNSHHIHLAHTPCPRRLGCNRRSKP